MNLHDLDHRSYIDLPVDAWDDTARLVAREPGTPPPLPCTVCAEEISPEEAWIAVVIDDPATVVAAAHIDIDPAEPEEVLCGHLLTAQWSTETTMLRGSFGLRHDNNRPHHYWVGDHQLCEGDPIAVLTGDGHWLTGRYTHQVTSHGPAPLIEITLGGCLADPVTIGIPRGALIRTP